MVKMIVSTDKTNCCHPRPRANLLQIHDLLALPRARTPATVFDRKRVHRTAGTKHKARLGEMVNHLLPQPHAHARCSSGLRGIDASCALHCTQTDAKEIDSMFLGGAASDLGGSAQK